jgi:excinuclease UvrABC nuclease subunit
MIKTRFLAPYSADGKTNFPSREKSGVYIIAKNEEIRYIGYSGSDVYKTMYRHFQSWRDSTQVRTTYKQLKDIKVRIVYCTPTQAATLERLLIMKYEPKDNPQKVLKFKPDKKEISIYSVFKNTPITKIENVPF